MGEWCVSSTFPFAQVHMNAARQTRIKAAHRAHNIDSLEFVWPVLFKDRRILHRILVRARRAINVTWICIPGSRRIRMIIGDLAFANHHMMRKHATHRFVESATNGLFRHFEFGPCPVCPACSSASAFSQKYSAAHAA